MRSETNIGKINVTVAIKGDSALPALKMDSLGDVSVGPHGLLRALETQLGSPSSETSFTARLIQYLGCLEQANNPKAFYHASYEADPFSVARTLLQWRDQWYLAGWQGSFKQDAPARLQDMAAIEQLASTRLDLSLGQRIARVIELLPDNPIAIDSITLRDALSDFPSLWRQLIAATVATGTTLHELPDTPPQANKDSDLGKLQRHLLAAGSDPITLRGDGTVIALRA